MSMTWTGGPVAITFLHVVALILANSWWVTDYLTHINDDSYLPYKSDFEIASYPCSYLYFFNHCMCIFIELIGATEFPSDPCRSLFAG